MAHLDAKSPPLLRRDSDLRMIVSPVINGDGTTSRVASMGLVNREHDIEGAGYRFGEDLDYPQFLKVGLLLHRSFDS